jgi:hypothetical protein
MFCYIKPILGHSTSKSYAKKSSREREFKRQEKEAMTTQRTTIASNANIIRIQRQVGK